MLQGKVALLCTTTSAIIKEFREFAVEEIVDAGDVNVVVLPHAHADVSNTHQAHFTERLLIDRPASDVVAHGVRIGLLTRPEDLIELPTGEVDVTIGKVKDVAVDPPTLADDR